LVLVQFCKERGLLVHKRFSGGSRNFGVGLKPRVAADVQHLVAMFRQYAAHKEASVAVRGVFLAAHQRYPKFSDAALQALYTGDECRVPCDAAVEDMPLCIVIRRIAGPSTKLTAEKEIFHAILRQRLLQNLSVKLWRKAGIRR
jgi:hypothetical protein